MLLKTVNLFLLSSVLLFTVAFAAKPKVIPADNPTNPNAVTPAEFQQTVQKLQQQLQAVTDSIPQQLRKKEGHACDLLLLK